MPLVSVSCFQCFHTNNCRKNSHSHRKKNLDLNPRGSTMELVEDLRGAATAGRGSPGNWLSNRIAVIQCYSGKADS